VQASASYTLILHAVRSVSTRTRNRARMAACAAHKPNQTLSLPVARPGSNGTGPRHERRQYAALQRSVPRRARLLQVADDRADAAARRRGRVHDGRLMRRRRHGLHRIAVHHGQHLRLAGSARWSMRRPARLALSWRPRRSAALASRTSGALTGAGCASSQVRPTDTPEGGKARTPALQAQTTRRRSGVARMPRSQCTLGNGGHRS